MSNKREPRCPQLMAPAPRKHQVRILYAMRNGFLYRSTDGVNWTLQSEQPVIALSIAEGMTVTVTVRH